VLQWAREQNCEWDEETCKFAAAGGHLGRLVQVASSKTRVESAYGFSACYYAIMNCLHRLLSISTCVATSGGVAVGAGTGLPVG
jgi:hypothetical protein